MLVKRYSLFGATFAMEVLNQPIKTTYLLTYLLTYVLTPWSRGLLEKLTGFQLVKKFPAFYGTRKFITALTSACFKVQV